jgi:hypothetical protein
VEPEYCTNCDNEATWIVVDHSDPLYPGPFYLCETCHDAFELALSGEDWDEECI